MQYFAANGHLSRNCVNCVSEQSRTSSSSKESTDLNYALGIVLTLAFAKENNQDVHTALQLNRLMPMLRELIDRCFEMGFQKLARAVYTCCVSWFAHYPRIATYGQTGMQTSQIHLMKQSTLQSANMEAFLGKQLCGPSEKTITLLCTCGIFFGRET